MSLNEKLVDNSIEQTFANTLGIDISQLEPLMKKVNMPLGDYMELTIILDNDDGDVDKESLKDFVFGTHKYARAFGKYLSGKNAKVAEGKPVRDPIAADLRTPKYKKRTTKSKEEIKRQKDAQSRRAKHKKKPDIEEETVPATGGTRKDPPNTQNQGTGVGSPGKTAKSGKSGQPGNFGESIEKDGKTMKYKKAFRLQHLTESQITRMMVEMPKKKRAILEHVMKLPTAELKRRHANIRGFDTPSLVEDRMSKRGLQEMIAQCLYENIGDFKIAWTDEGTSDKIWGYWVNGNQAMTFWGRRNKSYRFKEVPRMDAKMAFTNRIHNRGYADISKLKMATAVLQDAQGQAGITQDEQPRRPVPRRTNEDGSELDPAEMQDRVRDLEQAAKRPGSEVSIDADGTAIDAELSGIADDPQDPNGKIAVVKNKQGGETMLADLGNVALAEDDMADEVMTILQSHGMSKIDDDTDLSGSDLGYALYSYFLNSGEMPYGTAKARTGDPDEWIYQKLEDMGLVDTGSSAFEGSMDRMMKLSGAGRVEESEDDYWECPKCGTTNEGDSCKACGCSQIEEDGFEEGRKVSTRVNAKGEKFSRPKQ